jgi:HAD superfamily hydrolase (TIGR01490 family)
MQGASIFHLARGLYDRDFFNARDIGKFAWQQAKFRVLGRENLDNVTEARETALSFAAGHTVAELTSIGEEVFDEVMAAKVWPGTRALAQMHLDAGQRVWLVTATPVEVASVIAGRLGLTGALGTVSETKDCVYTGRLVGEILHGEAKAEAVRALVAREGLNLARCAAYSDSANDIPLLSMVGQPCAINPDGRLRAHAKEHGWRVRDYRTGRKAAKIGLPTAAGLGAVAGAVSAAVAVRRRGR